MQGLACAGPELGISRPLVILMSRWLAPVSGTNIFKIMFHRRDEGGRSTVTPPMWLRAVRLCPVPTPPPFIKAAPLALVLSGVGVFS